MPRESRRKRRTKKKKMIKRKKHKKVTVHCCVCGKAQKIYFCWAKRQKSFTCSVECKAMKLKTKVNCFICGKEFFEYKRFVKKSKRHICSSKICQKKFNQIRGVENGICKPAQRVIVRCAGCNKKIIKTEFQANKNKKHYCSNECRKKYNTCMGCGKELKHKYDQTSAKRMGKKGYCLQCWRDKFSKKYNTKSVTEGHRWCPRCKKELPENDFSPKATSWCRKCERKKAIELDKKNPQNRLRRNISRRILFSLKDGKNGRGWEKLTGYTAKQLIKHLEKQFQPGMTWENYGAWHIDHETPISVFNFTQPQDIDFKRCWALSNLQPMWAYDNLSKGAKINGHFQPSLQLQGGA